MVQPHQGTELTNKEERTAGTRSNRGKSQRTQKGPKKLDPPLSTKFKTFGFHSHGILENAAKESRSIVLGVAGVALIYVTQHMEGMEGAPRKLPFVPSKHGASLNANNAQ